MRYMMLVYSTKGPDGLSGEEARTTEAAIAYRSALSLATNHVERRFLERRLSEMEVRGS